MMDDVSRVRYKELSQYLCTGLEAHGNKADMRSRYVLSTRH
jgi:hypothetical protein